MFESEPWPSVLDERFEVDVRVLEIYIPFLGEYFGSGRDYFIRQPRCAEVQYVDHVPDLSSRIVK